MSTLGKAVADKLGLNPAEVEALLAEHGVSTTASTPVPAHLKFTRLRFTAIKKLTGVNSEGIDVGTETVQDVAAEFDWELESGLHGIGSDRNLRGKTSILQILMWALRGRCDLRQDVRTWLRHVEVDLLIDMTAYRVAFDVTGGVPEGEVLRAYRGDMAVMATFSNEAEFEDAMESTMMAALRLPVIAATQEGRRTQHSWPAYAGALLIHGDTLDQLLGDIKFAGLPSRLLQMFIGADWAAARAEATTALTLAQARIGELQNAADTHASAMSEAHTHALKAVAAARQTLDDLPELDVGLQSIGGALEQIGKLDGEVAARHSQLLLARAIHAEVVDQLTAEHTRKHRTVEDAVAIRFFQQMRPTLCPRCSAPVTGDRRQAEAIGEACSICTTELDLHALAHDHVVSTSASESDRLKFTGAAFDHGHDDGNRGDDDGDAVDSIAALERGLAEVSARLDTAETAYQDAVSGRNDAAQRMSPSPTAQLMAGRRRDAELAVARAEGAASVLAPKDGHIGPDQDSIDSLRSDAKVLNAAKTIVSSWVTSSQQQPLLDLGMVITGLARSFGMTNLTTVELNGGAAMKVTTGGAQSSYSDCERGEKLRLKLATAIALIQQGREVGIGRHPGLLLVDSPGAEEMADDDFDTMLDALNTAVTDADIQVFIGTRHVHALLELLGAEHCRVGPGTRFVW